MDVVKLEAQPRSAGKKVAREVRRAGRVPCVLYGRGAETIAFSLDDLAMHRLVFTDELHRLQVNLGGESFDCILKSFDMDPVHDVPMHADFQILMENEVIELAVPIQFVGTAKGQREGGDVHFVIHELMVSCLPRHIPDSLEVDISDLGIGDIIHVSDLSFENLEMITPPQQSVVSVTAKKAEEPEEVATEAGEEVEGQVEGEAESGDEEAADE